MNITQSVSITRPLSFMHGCVCLLFPSGLGFVHAVGEWGLAIKVPSSYG